ncbi:MAG: SpoIIE family protein phosphatase, partial [Acidobacteria bacterium]|nr:SpoIIE family protein phosphatase [Acidobacteriota bacterium]
VGFSYRERDLSLAAGDTVLLMSDGLPELVGPDGDVLGYEKTRELFLQVASEPPDVILRRLFEAAEKFAAGHPQEDDLTLVVLRAK